MDIHEKIGGPESRKHLQPTAEQIQEEFQSKVQCGICKKKLGNDYKNHDCESETKGCICQKWRENITLINGPQLQAVRSGTKGYEGEPFRFCPWCSRKLDAPIS